MLRSIKGIDNRTENVIMPPYGLEWPHLEYCRQLLSSHLQKDIAEVEKGNKDDWAKSVP